MPTHRQLEGHVRVHRVPLTIVAGLLAVACTSDDDTASDPPSSAPEASSTTRPDATADAIAETTADIEDLLDDYNRTVNAIIADPAVANDEGASLVQSYLALFEPGSDIPRDALDGWRQQAADGIAIEPVNDAHPAISSHLDGAVALDSPDEARFPTCDALRYKQIDATGQITDLVENQLQHGEGVAVLIDGEWLLRDLRILADGQGCKNPEGEP